MIDIEEFVRSMTNCEKPDFYRAIHEAVDNAFAFGINGKDTEVKLDIYEGTQFIKATVYSESLPFDCAAYRSRMQARALSNNVEWTKLVDQNLPGRGFWRMLENTDFMIFGNGTMQLYLKKPYQKRMTRRAQSLVIRLFVRDEAGNII